MYHEGGAILEVAMPSEDHLLKGKTFRAVYETEHRSSSDLSRAGHLPKTLELPIPKVLMLKKIKWISGG